MNAEAPGSGAYDRLPCAVLRLDRERKIRYLNRRALELVRDDEPEALLGEPLGRVLASSDPRREAFTARVAELAPGRASVRAECALRSRDGATATLAWTADYRNSADDDWPITLVGVELAADGECEGGELFRRLVTLDRRGIVVSDPAGVILYANPAEGAITGYRPDELIGRRTEIFRSGRTPADVYSDLWRTVDAGGIWQGEFVNRRKDGGQYLEAKTMGAVRDGDGVVRYYVSVCEDVSEREQHRDRIGPLAAADPLTGLANRAAFMQALSVELEMARQRGQAAMLLHVDLDGFGKLNREAGAEDSDRVLVEIAHRLKEVVRRGDVVARFSGDNFAVFVESAAWCDGDDVGELCDRMLAAIRRPCAAGASGSVEVGASIGVARFPEDADSADELLANAMAATRSVKDGGGNGWRRFDLSVADVHDAKHELRTDLRHAAKRNELVLQFQPQLSLRSGQIVGVEALVRWRHPTRGLLAPAAFMPLAEEGNAIVGIDSWVLDEACRQVRAWLDAGLPPVAMAINFSARQFKRADLKAAVGAALAAHRVEPRSLGIEITESAMMHDGPGAARVTAQLKELGVRLALDDFGTGYSSLAHLSRLPIDVVKIDRSFVRDITTNPANAAIVQATIAMSKKLGKTVIAEGVETEEQMEFLRRSECDEMQGYLFSPPQSADDIARMLGEGAGLDFAGPGRDQARDTVLLVDDEPNILSALKRVLRREGYEILTAASAEEGLALLAKQPVKLIVSDQRMPGMNGTEFLSRVKSLHPQTVRLVLSGYSEISAVTDAINRGAIYRFLTKPWEDEDLKEELRGAMRHWQELFGRSGG